MKHFVITLLILAVIVCGVVAEIKIEETYVKTTAEETATETTTIKETTTAPTTAKIETTEPKTEALTEKTTTDTTTTEKVKISGKFGRKPLGTFYITGYTAEEGFPYGSATASGVGAKPGICALNDSQRKELGIKYGDTIYIDGLGTYTVADCGCAYGVVDVWVYTNAEAYSITGYREVYR